MGDTMGNRMKALLNVIIGIVLIVFGIVWYSIRIPYVAEYIEGVDCVPFYEILVLFIVGLFGVCIFFIGLILAWMGWEDYRTEKETVHEPTAAGNIEEESSTQEELTEGAGEEES